MGASRDELWLDSMPNNQNFEQRWRSDFGMNEDTSLDIMRVVKPVL